MSNVTALAVAQQDEWTKERVEVVKRQLCPSGVTDAELSVFIEVCKRSGLDPFQKEIFCVPRKTNVGTRDNPRWIQKHEAQPAEAGMLARADRFPDFRGLKAAAVYSGDDILIDENTVSHKFNPAQRKGALIGAWAQAFRDGRVYPVEWITLEAYKQDTKQWREKPDTMLVKCARAAALRRAYPNAFAGLYVREEMPAEEFEAAPAGQPVAKRGLDAIPKAPALPESTGLLVDVKPGETEEAAELRVRAESAKKATLPSGPLAKKSDDALAEDIIAMEAWLEQAKPNDPRRGKASAKLDELKAEMDRRQRANAEPPLPLEDAQ